jgi:P-type conjugative transfer protein TrbG
MRRLSILWAAAGLIVLTGCAHQRASRDIPLDDLIPAQPLPESPRPVKIIEVPQPLPLPGQLKPTSTLARPATPETPDPKDRIAQANRAARIEPAQSSFLNATQVWPYSAGSLYQIYASPERVTDVALEAGEELISVSAGDTVRWVIGDTLSGAGAEQRVHILVKPIRADLHTNLIINTARRTYHLELTSTTETWMASVSWQYPFDRLLALKSANQEHERALPIAEGLALERLQFRYEISGDEPSWRPVRAFDDGEKVYIQFPHQIAQGEMPPLFVVGPVGESELVNYRVRAPYYIVDRLFAAAELRLGGPKAQTVRITRTDLRGRLSTKTRDR